MKSKIKLVSMLFLAMTGSLASAEELAADAPGFFTCYVKNEARDTMYVTTQAFAGASDKSKELAQSFADEVLKTHPEAGSLDMPMCNFGVESKYADMYLDQIKGQFSGDLVTLDFAPVN